MHGINELAKVFELQLIKVLEGGRYIARVLAVLLLDDCLEVVIDLRALPDARHEMVLSHVKSRGMRHFPSDCASMVQFEDKPANVTWTWARRLCARGGGTIFIDSEKLAAPTGRIINSCMASLFPAWLRKRKGHEYTFTKPSID